MNLYDFDKTIYLYDSTFKFFLHCLKQNPAIAFRLPSQALAFALWKLGIKDKMYFKQRFFCFLRSVKNVETEIERFWDKQEKNICRWFLDCKSEGDIVVSASPEFLIRPITERLCVKCIATQVDCKSGKFLSPNCYGEEKTNRLRKIGITEVEKAYSDSKSDLPMLNLAASGYIVKNSSIEKCKMVEISKTCR